MEATAAAMGAVTAGAGMGEAATGVVMVVAAMEEVVMGVEVMEVAMTAPQTHQHPPNKIQSTGWTGPERGFRSPLVC